MTNPCWTCPTYVAAAKEHERVVAEKTARNVAIIDQMALLRNRKGAEPSAPPPPRPYTIDERFASERAWDERYYESLKEQA